MELKIIEIFSSGTTSWLMLMFIMKLEKAKKNLFLKEKF
jgi:hypothetical protein